MGGDHYSERFDCWMRVIQDGKVIKVWCVESNSRFSALLQVSTALSFKRISHSKKLPLHVIRIKPSLSVNVQETLKGFVSRWSFTFKRVCQPSSLCFLKTLQCSYHDNKISVANSRFSTSEISVIFVILLQKPRLFEHFLRLNIIMNINNTFWHVLFKYLL